MTCVYNLPPLEYVLHLIEKTSTSPRFAWYYQIDEVNRLRADIVGSQSAPKCMCPLEAAYFYLTGTFADWLVVKKFFSLSRDETMIVIRAADNNRISLLDILFSDDRRLLWEARKYRKRLKKAIGLP